MHSRILFSIVILCFLDDWLVGFVNRKQLYLMRGLADNWPERLYSLVSRGVGGSVVVWLKTSVIRSPCAAE